MKLTHPTNLDACVWNAVKFEVFLLSIWCSLSHHRGLCLSTYDLTHQHMQGYYTAFISPGRITSPVLMTSLVPMVLLKTMYSRYPSKIWLQLSSEVAVLTTIQNTTHTILSASCLGIHPPDCTHTQLSFTQTWHGCQLSPSPPEVINRLFTVSLETMMEDCWKPLCSHFKPLNSFTRTLIVTPVTMCLCVLVVLHNVPYAHSHMGQFVLHTDVHACTPVMCDRVTKWPAKCF